MAIEEAVAVVPKVSEEDLALIRLLCLPYKIIGEKFGVPAATVNMRVTRLIIRFGVENRMAIVVKALKFGLVTVDQLVYRNYGRTNLS